ncbi:hypothetical protein IAR55_004656 [Kwoniella newhampshirensis]|uniref:Uncharacterized protein n=1 Tax=Kwoniella newhampshirensis TaxID=1651941 RepID=A0AAW0YQ19_9TREE
MSTAHTSQSPQNMTTITKISTLIDDMISKRLVAEREDWTARLEERVNRVFELGKSLVEARAKIEDLLKVNEDNSKTIERYKQLAGQFFDRDKDSAKL